jgi:hypothetical protein
MSPLTFANDFQALLVGKRLIMQGCDFCGMEFVGVDTLLRYVEIAGDQPVSEYRVRWLSSNLFLATQKGRNGEGCPPRILLFRVERATKHSAMIKEYWTGWPSANDDVDRYRIVARNQ